MARTCCHVSLAFILKCFNFLQAFVGISIIVYSAWMLDRWNHQVPVSPPPSPVPALAPSPASSASFYLNSESVSLADRITAANLAGDLIPELGTDLELDLNAFKLPAPWFIYSFMGLGIMLCSTTLVGCIAAEAISGCCLCFYNMLIILFILVEVALVSFIAIDRRWEKDLPFDPTGELDGLRKFIEDNVDLCKWIGIIVISTQALSLLLAIILRSMVSTRKTEYDTNEEIGDQDRIRETLLNPPANQASGAKFALWGARMREKYGLKNSE
ncbi:tetraspanin-20-like [Cucurbita moschata]|uniref:Tetraspanin-20-like n=1 Tax=Cucurbita moschata TaxID=3662 RepID=A0A6J1ET48_CUCMO|nr:tetraspanin-20-like [Cucurbita moschata]XP_022931237.1 tetraspanin-20-like [Cucurbita moschata]